MDGIHWPPLAKELYAQRCQYKNCRDGHFTAISITACRQIQQSRRKAPTAFTSASK